MNSPMKVGLVGIFCVLGAGASLAAEVEVSIPAGSTKWAEAIAGKTINEGDILSVTIGDNLTSYSLGGWSSPKLAGVKVSGNRAWNISNGTFNFQPTATFEAVETTRVILNTVQLNPASALALEKTGSGILQFYGVQTCSLRLKITQGSVYVHQDAALGAIPAETLEDAITLNGGTLWNGFSNTSLGTVTLAATRGITIASGKTGNLAVVASQVAGQLASDFIIRGPISGDGGLSIATTTVKVNASPVYLTIAGACTYAGETSVSNPGCLSFEPGGALPASTTLTAGSSGLTIALNGTSQTVGALANNNFILDGPGLLTVSDRTTLFPSPTCKSGAAVAITESEIETARGKSASYAVVNDKGEVTKLLDNASYGMSSLPKIFEFRFAETCSNEAAYVAVSEIELTKGGVPIDRSCYDLPKCTASSEGTGKPVENLFDSCGNTYWTSAVKPTANGFVVVRVVLKGASAGVDGYRLGAGDMFDCSTNPKSWQVVEISANGQETVLDAKTNVNLTPRHATVTNVGFAGNLSVNFTFSEALTAGVGTGLEIGPNATYLVGAGDAQTLGKLTGSGTLSLGADAVATVDLGEFAGDVKATGEATLRLTASTRVCATTEGASAVAYDAAVSGVNVLVDDQSGAAPLRGKLTGSIGLVKRDEGERTLQTERSDNTGKVRVEGGTLTVSAARSVPETSVTARYIQFVPLQNFFGKQGNKINISLNEFELLDENGAKVAWPNGKTISLPTGCFANGQNNLIDGAINTRCYLTGTDDIPYVPFTVDTNTGVTFAKYRWYTAMNTSNSSYGSDRGRTPTEWEIRVSDDNETWRTVHHGTGNVAEYGDGSTSNWKDSNGFLRGPYDLDLAGAFPAPEFGALPADMVVKGGAADTVAAAVKARYLRFMPYGTVAKAVGRDIKISENFGCAFSEFDLYRNGIRIEWNGASASVPNFKSYHGEVRNLVDNEWTSNRFYPFTFPFDVVIDAGEGQTVEFDAYGFHNDTANGARRPDSWKLWISNDSENWYEVDAQNDVQSSDVKSAEAGRWSIAGKLSVTNTFTTTAIGDAAPVEIAQGATLKLDTDREAFGALSGAGTLELVRGAVAAVNAAAGNAGFSGTVTGAGKLDIAGEGVQTFDGATLDGGVTLGFAGGALAGGLTVNGALVVEGDVKFAVPANATKGFSQQLLSWTSIDDASKAKLQAATIVNGSGLKTKNFKLIVTDAGCTLKYEAPGMAIVVR